jgi:hypothetical protein
MKSRFNYRSCKLLVQSVSSSTSSSYIAGLHFPHTLLLTLLSRDWLFKFLAGERLEVTGTTLLAVRDLCEAMTDTHTAFQAEGTVLLPRWTLNLERCSARLGSRHG